MSLGDMSRELSHQRIAELHADAERYRQVRMSKRRRQRRSRGRLGRLLRPAGVAARANAIVGGILSPALVAPRPDRPEPPRPRLSRGRSRPGPSGPSGLRR